MTREGTAAARLSKSSSSTRLASREKTLKLTPSRHTLAPIGALAPAETRLAASDEIGVDRVDGAGIAMLLQTENKHCLFPAFRPGVPGCYCSRCNTLRGNALPTSPTASRGGPRISE